MSPQSERYLGTAPPVSSSQASSVGAGDGKQEDQLHRKALKDLVQSWMDRLQLISLITTFFASVESGMLQITTPNPGDPTSGWNQASNATFAGALVMHVAAAGISFLGAFALIKYKVKAAKTEEKEAEARDPSPVSRAVEFEESRVRKRRKLSSNAKTLWSEPPNHLIEVGPWRAREPPVNLLSRCHFLSVILSVLGFILALLGILCFTWDRQPLSVSIFTSSCMGVCLVCGSWILTTQSQDEYLIYARV